jgi:chorismate dehydratase
MTKLKVTAVSYLNTKPFLYGIFNNRVDDFIDLKLDIPSVCAEKLKSGEADLGLVPVAVLPELETPHIVSDYCIGSIRSVRTVCLFSEKPIEEITEIYLDYHSRTSVELTKILLKKHWKVAPKLIEAKLGFEKKIKGSTAALVIGDRAIQMHAQFPYSYDLGEAWNDYSGLPFVYAAWVSNRPLDDTFLTLFNQALSNGVDHIPKLVYLLPTPQPGFDLQEYFTNNISYNFDSNKRKALSRFLSEMNIEIQPSLSAGLVTN